MSLYIHDDVEVEREVIALEDYLYDCLLYTSDAADERSSVDLGGRRIIKKKTSQSQIDDINTNTTPKSK